MKKIILAIISLISSFSYALHVECIGNATLIDNDGDTLLVFASDPELRTLSSVGEVDWYRLPDTTQAIQTGTDYLYPEHGEGYAIKVDSVWEMFWVFDYSQLAPQIQSISVVQTCTESELQLEGEIPAIAYTDANMRLATYDRLCQVSWKDVMWSESAWADSLAVAQAEFSKQIIVGASAVATEYTIVDLLAEELHVGDTIATELCQPMALKIHPQAIVTARGEVGEQTNEVDRPVDTETLLKRSAPLEVEFLANGLNADHYEWRFYKGTEEFLKRTEAIHRYVFEEAGNYRVVLCASNNHGCQTDSAEFSISVSESMLKVPNVFTPNGDGSNDEFRVVYRSIKEYNIWVYNRWGHLVYKSNDPAKGWDGTINGRPAAVGAYYYVIRALGTDAEMGYMMKPKYSKKLKKQELPIGVYQLSGDINLLR